MRALSASPSAIASSTFRRYVRIRLRRAVLISVLRAAWRMRLRAWGELAMFTSVLFDERRLRYIFRSRWSISNSPISKLCLALVDEGFHALFLIFGGKQRVKCEALVFDAFSQCRFKGTVHARFCKHRRGGGMARDLVADGNCFLNKVLAFGTMMSRKLWRRHLAAWQAQLIAPSWKMRLC